GGGNSATPFLRGRMHVLLRLDDVPRRLPAEEPEHVVQGGLHRVAALARDRVRDVRRHEDVREFVERTVERPSMLRVRVGPPDIEGRAESGMGPQVFEQIVFEDDLTAGDVHEDRVGLHRREERAIHEARGLPREREGQDDEVGARKEPTQVVNHRGLIQRGILRARSREPDRVHAERLAQSRDLGSNPAHPEEQDRRSGEALVHHALVEDSAADLLRAHHHVLRRGEEEGHRMFRDGRVVGPRVAAYDRGREQDADHARPDGTAGLGPFDVGCSRFRYIMNAPHFSTSVTPLPFRFVYTGIRVRDMDESIRFYTQVLGMTLVERMTTAPTKGEVATLRSPGSEQELELNFYEEGSPFWAPYSNGEDLDHLAFEVENLVATVGDLRRKGVEIIVEPYSIGDWSESY